MTRLIGYARGGLNGDDVESAVEALTRARCLRVFTDVSAADPRGRAGLSECLQFLGSGDALVVTESAHLSHSVTHFVATVSALTARSVGFRSLTEPALSTGRPTDPADVVAALEGLRRRLVSVRTRAGMEVAASEGRRAGRPTVMTPERVAMAVELRTLGRPITHIARVLGVSANSVQRALVAVPQEPGSQH